MTNDVLQPIRDGNRDEIFVVEYEGFIKNITEGILRAMLRDLEEWELKYPTLKEFENLTAEELYDQTLLFNPEEFLTLISDGKKPIEEIIQDVKELLPEVIITEQQTTVFEFALYRLLHEDFVKKCYIIKSSSFLEYEVDYIRTVYSDCIDKIEAGEGDLLSLLSSEAKDATTIFFSDVETLTKKFLDEFGFEGLEGKMFILRNCLNNITFSQTQEDTVDLAYVQELETLNEMGYFGVSRMFVTQMDKEEMLSRNGTYHDFVNPDEEEEETEDDTDAPEVIDDEDDDDDIEYTGEDMIPSEDDIPEDTI